MYNHSLAVVFPGQSSQHIGMLSNFANHYQLVKETFSEVSEILSYDLWKLIQYGPIQQLNETYYSQPAVLTASVVIWRIWRAQGGLIPNIIAGHSLGEYSALVCAESIDLLSAIKLIIKRSILMQRASPFGYGAMSVIIGLDDSIVLEFCKLVKSKYNQIVDLSGFNAYKNTLISGHKEAVHQVCLLCQKAGAKYILLPISVAAHCDLMKPVIEDFQEELKKITIRIPNIPIINNADVHFVKNPEDISKALVQQLYMPVRWKEIVQKMIDKKITIFLEMGPGKVLTRFIRNSTDLDICSLAINDINSLKKAMMKIHSN